MSESLGRDRIERRAGAFCFTETWHAPALVLNEHEHELACVHFVLAGCYCETFDGRERQLQPGALLYKPPGVRHANRFHDVGARTLRLELDRELVADLGDRARLARDTRENELELLARRLHAELLAEDDLSPLALEGLALELTAALFRRARDRRNDLRLAERCAEHLQERFRGSLGLSDLAREFGADRTALARAFRARFRTSIGEYLRRLRVGEVMRELSRGERRLVDISLAAGFADQSHCTRVFRTLTGLTPSAWARRTGVHAARERRLDL
ncbi:MAG: AraC family transcriptional regulator [Planctomycetes bacterium]|nr:AraC family transcriptional regulator [Planctomycetota bacterium]